MVCVYHSHNKLEEVIYNGENIPVSTGNISEQLFELAALFPHTWIVWCDASQKGQLNINNFQEIFHHKRIMASCGGRTYFSSQIGYVENSPFLKVNTSVVYPTWQMHATAGAIHAEVLLAVKDKIPADRDFPYFLNSLAKLTTPLGLHCYFAPGLLKLPENLKTTTASAVTLFRFVKQHYRTRWVFLLFFNLLWFERSFPLGPFFYSLFFRRRKLLPGILNSVEIQSSKVTTERGTVDIVIPTIGRKKYLYNVLQDLKVQTHLPRKVIIVEQNPEKESETELDYLRTKSWPFEIHHDFIRQTGACNARNLASLHLNSEWVFFADDDIRMNRLFLEKAFEQIKHYGALAVTFSCIQKGELPSYNRVFQWNTFGSGCSMVRTGTIKENTFDMAYEHGFGEDADYGMQIRNNGVDIIYMPEPSILHLKAPLGGFRSKPELPWDMDPITPKPAPPIMLFHLKHRTREQLLGYKLTLFLKYYRQQSVKNPFSYYKLFKKQWKRSIFWAKKLGNPKANKV